MRSKNVYKRSRLYTRHHNVFCSLEEHSRITTIILTPIIIDFGHAAAFSKAHIISIIIITA